jgi:hypothetical protein
VPTTFSGSPSTVRVLLPKKTSLLCVTRLTLHADLEWR